MTNMAEIQATILCIEDERAMIELFKLILKRHDFHVIGALGGEQGLQLASEVRSDLILLDLMMPGMDGWTVYQNLRTNPEQRHIPVIVITAKVQTADDLVRFQQAGLSETIAKPFRPQELVEAVHRALELAPE